MFSLVLMLYGCKKRQTAGFGGQANVDCRAFHHGLAIDSFTVYIKFNSEEAPSDGNYDAELKSTQQLNGTYAANFEGLKAGQYYLLGIGWDPSIQQIVRGGLPYEIKEEIDLMVDLAITEE